MGWAEIVFRGPVTPPPSTLGNLWGGEGYCTAKTEIIETGARTLELPLLVRSVASAEGRRIFLAVFSPPNLKEEILDVLAPVSIISFFTGTAASYIYLPYEQPTNYKQR